MKDTEQEKKEMAIKTKHGHFSWGTQNVCESLLYTSRSLLLSVHKI